MLIHASRLIGRCFVVKSCQFFCGLLAVHSLEEGVENQFQLLLRFLVIAHAGDVVLRRLILFVHHCGQLIDALGLEAGQESLVEAGIIRPLFFLGESALLLSLTHWYVRLLMPYPLIVLG